MMPQRFRCFLLFILFLAAALVAESIPQGLQGSLNWRLIGPFRGGRSVAATGVSGSGSIFYFGAVDGGIWKTLDAGATWSAVFEGQDVASIGALAIAPSDSNTIYAGTGESDIRSNLASGNGVYKSVDAGQTWRNIGLKDTRQISRIVVDAKNPDHVLVAALGHAYGPNDERGIFVSDDGGRHWDKTLFKGPSIGAADLSIAADAPDVVFAALWEAHRPPWSTYAPIAGEGSGLYRSLDGGKNWTQINGHGFPAKVGRIGIAVSGGTRAKKIYASVEGDAESGGLYRSDDGGETWSRVNADSRLTSRGWYFSSITADPNDPDVLYIPNVALYKLSDGGKTLSIVRGAPGGDDYHQLWIDPSDSRHMVLATDQGTSVSLNAGASWSTWYNQPTAQMYHVATDNAYPYHVYGAQQDSGTAALPSRTDHGQIDARDFFVVGASESGWVAPDPKDPKVFYVSGTFGAVDRFDLRTQQSQNIAPWPAPASLAAPSERKFRDPWTPVLLFSPLQHNALYLGTQYVMRTLDGGLHWQTISPDLTGADKAASADKSPLSADNAKQRGYGVVYSIAPSPIDANLIWAGSDSGLIHVTRDGGKHWGDVTPAGVAAWSKITHLEASHFAAGEAFAAVDRHRMDDMHPYAYRTRDFGKTWQPVSSGIAERSFLNVIREDPKCKGLLYAGTEFGVYVSIDDGDSWQSLQLNLPVTSVRDLVIQGDDLVIATHGRSFWILDDMTLIRQLTSFDSAKTVLFGPGQAVRTTSDSFLGTPLPPEEPQAQNPLRGAYLDYFLPESTAGEVKLEVFDASGKMVRRFSSRNKLPPVSSQAPPIAPRWIHPAAGLPDAAGMHRLVWDLRYERSGDGSIDDDDDENLNWPGPLVLPGRYTVKLSANGSSIQKMLQVVIDPRESVTPAELLQQFTWAERAFKDVVAARKISSDLASLEVSIKKDKAALGTDHADLTDALSALDKSVGELSKGESLQSVVRALTSALTAMEGADRIPTSQVIEVYTQASKALQAKAIIWNEIKQKALPKISGQLRAAGLDSL